MRAPEPLRANSSPHEADRMARYMRWRESLETPCIRTSDKALWTFCGRRMEDGEDSYDLEPWRVSTEPVPTCADCVRHACDA